MTPATEEDFADARKTANAEHLLAAMTLVADQGQAYY